MADGPTQGPVDDGGVSAGYPVPVAGVDSTDIVHTVATDRLGVLLVTNQAIRQLLEEILIELKLGRGVEI